MAEIFQKFINASRGRGFEGGDGKGGTSPMIEPPKKGLTDEAASQQANAFDALAARRRRFQTVFAGETGTGGNDKLGLVGKI